MMAMLRAMKPTSINKTIDITSNRVYTIEIEDGKH